jgi:hypothetical protein
MDKFLEKGLKGTRVKLAGAMAADGISKYVTFFNDKEFIKAQSAAAHQQMRELKPEEIEPLGLLHAFVELHAMGKIPASKMNRRYRDQRAHLVIVIGGKAVQPVAKGMIRQSDQSAGSAILGLAEGKITLQFSFDVKPSDLHSPVNVVLIDGDGNRHELTATLDGALDVD